MSEFHAEIAAKKKLASGSRHKKNGVKSKKCTLPSDHLTPAQIKKLSGEVHTLQLNRPMLWHEFKALPVSLQQEYISHLQETVNVGYVNIAKMLGCAAETLKTHLLVADIRFQIKKGTTSRAARVAWREFVHPQNAEPEEVVAEEPEIVHEEEPVKAPENWPILPDSLTLDITGDPVLLAEYIKALPLKGEFRMRVCLERVVEEGE